MNASESTLYVSPASDEEQLNHPLAAKLADTADSSTTDTDADSGDTDASNERCAQATLLIELAANVELFHDSAGNSYARFRVNGHYEIAGIKSRAFTNWLSLGYYTVYKRATSSQAVNDAVNTLAAKARFDGDEREVHLRVAEVGHAIYVDLCDSEWRVVEVDACGWRVVDQSPVMFRRSKGMLPLPTPVAEGRLTDLRKYINVSEQEWALLAAWLVAALRPKGPYPILAVHGEQGSAKSTLCRLVRMLTDPNQAALRSEPKNIHDLVIAANNSRVICLDNLSRISAPLSDAMCRLATGGGFATRQLYENDEEVIFDAQRPQILNGIEELGTRSDLIDRVLMLNLPAISAEHRRAESELLQEFEEERPRIMGALLTAVSCAIRRFPDITLSELPRMADFALWATAAEPALELADGEFMRSYSANRSAGNDLAVEASPVGKAIMDFVDHEGGSWCGSATELLSLLGHHVDESTARLPGWPKSPQALGGDLKRLAPNLRAIGVDVVNNREGHKRNRKITLERIAVDDQPAPIQDDAEAIFAFDAADSADSADDISQDGQLGWEPDEPIADDNADDLPF